MTIHVYNPKGSAIKVKRILAHCNYKDRVYISAKVGKKYIFAKYLRAGGALLSEYYVYVRDAKVSNGLVAMQKAGA